MDLCFFLKLTMILHNAPDELGKLLLNYFSNMISWSNKRLDILNMIVTQKMGLFNHRMSSLEPHSDFNRHQSASGKVRLDLLAERRNSDVSFQYQVKSEKVDLEQAIKESIPPKAISASGSWNIELIFCNLSGSHPPLSTDLNQDLIQRHGAQLLQLREHRKHRHLKLFLNEFESSRRTIFFSFSLV